VTHYTYTIVETRRENPRTRTLVFDRALPAQPGQFVMAWLPGVDERPFSIAEDAPLALTVAAVGPFSERLHGLNVGDRVWVRGPLGQGYRLPQAPAGRRLLLVGGGYGAAPLHFLARTALDAGMVVEACLGARTSRALLLVEAFRSLGIAVRVTTEDGTSGTQGLITRAFERAVGAARPDLVCACGPVGMLEALERQCLALGLPHQLSWEAHMRCGMGLCGACEVHGRRSEGWLACQDGPVSFGGVCAV
jgi:dihydroorotate dehydrogenase electron transfer subunit